MKKLKRHRFTIITLVYWFLLLYIVIALIFWYMELNSQNKKMYLYRVEQLKKDAPDFERNIAAIEDARKRKTAQYIGEGSTFLLLILVGAVFVYRATRKQFRLSQQQQNFMMAVTHELKTPIAVARLNLETMQKRRLEEAQQQKLISTTLQEANRLNNLTNNILVASQLEAGAYSLNRQELNLSEIAEQCVQDFQTRFPQRNIQAAIHPGVQVKSEYALLQMLINNLLDNAIKYSDKEGSVQVIINKNAKYIMLSVTDEGMGIPLDEKKRIFDKFYRVGSEQTRTTKGTGLGLYLCKKIVKELKGTIIVTDNVPKGSIFTVKF